MNKRALIYSVIATILLVLLEEFVGFTHISKQVVRIGLFIVIPVVAIYFIKKSSLKKEMQFGKPTLKELKVAALSSVVIFLGTIGLFFLLQFMVPSENVIDGLSDMGIGMHNVWLWGIYMTVINSLIEEFFFRGYVFYSIEKHSKRLAIIVSALLFSSYHVIVFVMLFPIWTVVFTLSGLFLVGVFLAYINKYGKSFFNSWMIHASADFAIVLIGIYILTTS